MTRAYAVFVVLVAMLLLVIALTQPASQPMRLTPTPSWATATPLPERTWPA